MSLMKFAAMAAVAMAVVPAFAQETTTTTTTTQETTTTTQPIPVDNTKNPAMYDWTPGGVMTEDQIIANAKFLGAHDQFVLWKMLNRLNHNDEQLILQALSNAMFFNRDAAWKMWSNSPNTTVTTTTTTVTSDDNNPAMTPPTTGVTTSTTTVQTGTSRNQAMTGAMMYGVMGDVEAYDLLARNLDAEDRTAFRALWPTLTSTQQDVLLEIVKLTADPTHWRSDYFRSVSR